MKLASADMAGPARARRAREQGRVRVIPLALLCFLLGLAAGAFWIYRTTGRSAANASNEAAGQEAVALSDSTKAVLQRLRSPVEIRFYALLDPASVSDSLQAFARRADRLLSDFQRAGDGRIKVTRYDSQSDFDAAAKAAAADGIQTFNLDKGNACFLGFTAACNGQKESLPRLAPEWEQALESDLSRAIEHVASSSSPGSPLANKLPADTAAIEEVKRALPNLASLSVEDGTRILREAALKEFKAAADEMESQVKDARQRLSEAQSSGSEAGQQAAMKHLQEIQAEQTKRIEQIAAKSKAQIEALQQLKAPAR
jgi:hypothetical protein